MRGFAIQTASCGLLKAKIEKMLDVTFVSQKFTLLQRELVFSTQMQKKKTWNLVSASLENADLLVKLKQS